MLPAVQCDNLSIKVPTWPEGPSLLDGEICPVYSQAAAVIRSSVGARDAVVLAQLGAQTAAAAQEQSFVESPRFFENGMELPPDQVQVSFGHRWYGV